jgi:hypothetical protein
MKTFILSFLVLLALFVTMTIVCGGKHSNTPADAGGRQTVIIAAFAEDAQQLLHTLVLTESIRTFGGAFKDAPVWIYVPAALREASGDIVRRFARLDAQVKTSEAPQEALGFPFARKVFAASKAETEAVGKAPVLVWLDEDTVVLMEPQSFILAKGKSLGYRPVMHQNIGSLYKQAPDPFWARVYEKLSVPPAAPFPMKTVADGKKIRPYFNAGLLVVRPERGILRRWAEAFPVLYRDAALAHLCRSDPRMRVFLHQAALTGAILNFLKKDEMVQLPDSYNYPLFFKDVHEAEKEFNNIDGVVTLRYDVYFENPAADWGNTIQGPAAAVSWLRERLGKEESTDEKPATKMRFRFQEGEGARK